MTKILISAGEASGDLHAGAVTEAIKQLDKDAEVFGMGGDALRKAGGEVLFDIKDHSVMGLLPVIKKLPSIIKLMCDFVRVIDERKPDCLITIDYPGFNMELAKVCQRKGIPVVSFIAPSAWAWKKDRAKKVSKFIDVVASIFPFERDVYLAAGANVEFVGHPLLDIVHPTMSRTEAESWVGKRAGHRLVVLMPGSRPKEINNMLPIFIKTAQLIKEKMPDVDFAMPKAKTISKDVLEKSIKESGLEIKLIEGHNYDLFSVADIAVAKSGTVTLEAALCDLGSVIVYKTDPIFYNIAKLVVKIPLISLPNIIADREVLPELIQDAFTPENTALNVEKLLEPHRNKKMHEDLAEVKARLGEKGAVKRVAELALKHAQGSKNHKPKITWAGLLLETVMYFAKEKK
ncbi:MAG: lipid-A-disaccharide synthase [Phascolarctobacterium sp.]|nr:lipid-A-disaccharide synthase [Phascolarctobacterium sp.]